MVTKRIIPCLDVRNGRVVKGTNFEGIKDVADPVEMARLSGGALLPLRCRRAGVLRHHGQL